MTDDNYLDGNAIGGLLLELFGREMTNQKGCCDHCGAVNALGAVHVYVNAPGTIIRCPSCESVLIVIVEHRSGVRISFEETRWLETSTDRSS